MIFRTPKIYSQELNFTIEQIPVRNEPRNILMVSPDYFDVIDVKNSHMEGQLGKIDKKKAREQWDNLRNIYLKLKNLGYLDNVEVLEGVEGYEDMVFAANQTFPWITPNGEKMVIMSKMRHASRQREVAHFEKFYKDRGYTIQQLQLTKFFEGMGDTIPHPGKALLYGGYGHRSDSNAYEEISELLDVPIVILELIDERFYHLDTCFVPLDEDTVMLYPQAFTKDGMNMISKLFKKVIIIPESEAALNFALNAHVVPGKAKSVILQTGSKSTKEILSNRGFDIYETNTSEYMKSGGSVFCMKMMYY